MEVSDNYQKRKTAMKKRLMAMGKGNPVVAEAIKNQEPPQEDKKWQNWQIVDELVNAARHKYMNEEKGDLKKCLNNLAQALVKVDTKHTVDKKNGKNNNEDTDEDY